MKPVQPALQTRFKAPLNKILKIFNIQGRFCLQSIATSTTAITDEHLHILGEHSMERVWPRKLTALMKKSVLPGLQIRLKAPLNKILNICNTQ